MRVLEMSTNKLTHFTQKSISKNQQGNKTKLSAANKRLMNQYSLVINDHDIVSATIDVPLFHDHLLGADAAVSCFEAHLAFESGLDDVTAGRDHLVRTRVDVGHQDIDIIGVDWIGTVRRGALIGCALKEII